MIQDVKRKLENYISFSPERERGAQKPLPDARLYEVRKALQHKSMDMRKAKEHSRDMKDWRAIIRQF